MNEITKIHLGRIAFTISVDAHKELRQYLDAIKRHVGAKHKEVLDEVELRMAELLQEKGISGDKVVIKKDVEYLKEQLGSPSDFQDDTEESDTSGGSVDDRPRRFLRDPRDQMLGGVASGLGTYFGLDPWIFRAVFVALTVAGGSGILVYLILWLLVPKAHSKGDFLQMKGKPVTVEALTDYVESQEFHQDARRIGNRVARGVEEMFRALLRLARYFVGTILVTTALVSIIWTIIVGTYLIASPESMSDVGRLFPVGPQETGLLILGAAVLLSAFTLLLSSGIAFFKQKWPLPTWVSIALGAIFLVGSGVGTGLGIKTAPQVQKRYEAAHRTETRQLTEFRQLEVKGDRALVRYEPSDSYSVDVRSFARQNNNGIQTQVINGILVIDTSTFDTNGDCSWICVETGDPEVIVHAPRVDKITLHENVVFQSNDELRQDSLELVASKSADISFRKLQVDKVLMSVQPQSETPTLYISGISGGLSSDRLWANDDDDYTVSRIDGIQAPGWNCMQDRPYVYVWEMPISLTINGQEFTDKHALRSRQNDVQALDVNCVDIRR